PPLHEDDLLAKRRRERLASAAALAARVLEPLRTALAVAPHPRVERVAAHAPDPREALVRQARLDVRLDRRASFFRRVAPLRLRLPRPTPRPAARRRAGLPVRPPAS